jgi:hypothetical protein
MDTDHVKSGNDESRKLKTVGATTNHTNHTNASKAEIRFGRGKAP